MSWRRWPWPDKLALPLLLSVLRTFWLWPWLELARRGLAPAQTGPLLSLPLMVGVFLAGLVTARRALRGTGRLSRARLVVVGIGLVASLGLLWQQFYRPEYPLWQIGWMSVLGQDMTRWSQAVPAPFLVILAAVYLWQQGVRDGCKSLYHDEVWAAFAGGTLMLALAAVVAAATAGDLLAAVGSLVLPFFAAGMAALAFSSLQPMTGSPGRGTDEAPPGPNRYWFVSVISVVAGLLGLGLLLSIVITPDAVAHLLRGVSPALAFLQNVLLYAVLIISYPIFLILAPLIGWLKGRAQLITPGEGFNWADFQRQFQDLPGGGFSLAPAASEGIRWGGGLILILAIGLIFALALQRFWRMEEEPVEETRELMFSRQLLQTQLSSLWRRWLDRRKRRPGPLFDPFLSLAGEEPNRRVVRTIYQALLAAAAGRGKSRRPGQTPDEYQHTLNEIWPDSPEALDALTGGYMQARYAPDAPEYGQVEGVRRAWQELDSALAAQGDAPHRQRDDPPEKV